MMTNHPTSKRPALRYHGGKWLLAKRILEHFPQHRIYVEPFGGAASVLIQKPRAYGEIYNDLEDEVVNFFTVLRSGGAPDLQRALELTPFARVEFEDAQEVSTDPLERARQLVVRSFMGFGSAAVMQQYATGFRANSNRSGSTPAQDWKNYPENIPLMAERFRAVVIEHRPALKVIEQHDGPETLFYVDPPYLPETREKGVARGTKKNYTHEMTQDEHCELLRVLRQVDGMVVLSGYHSDLYEHMLQDWTRIDMKNFADGARPRTEVLWFNAAAALKRPHADLFEVEPC